MQGNIVPQRGVSPHPERTVEEAVTAHQDGFTMIPNAILRDSSLSMPARLTYAVVASYAYGHKDYCHPGQETIARHLGVSERSVRAYLDELVEAGYLKKKRRGLRKTNVYTVKDASDRKQASDQDAKLAGSEISDRKHTSDLDWKQGSVLDRKDVADEEDKVEENKNLIKQGVGDQKDFLQDCPIARTSDTSSPSEALSDGGLAAAGTEGSSDEDGFDLFEVETVMAAIDELHEEDEEPEELGDDDDVFFPGDGLNSVHFFFYEDGAPLRLARAVVEGKHSPNGRITVENVAEAIEDLQDQDIKGREMLLARRLIEAVSHQLEGAGK